MKKLFCVLVLSFAITSSHALDLSGSISTLLNVVSMPKSAKAQKDNNVNSLPVAPISAQYSQSFTRSSLQPDMFYSEQSHATFDDNAHHGHKQDAVPSSNISKVPVPAAFPLMATFLGIYGIARRRKAFK